MLHRHSIRGLLAAVLALTLAAPVSAGRVSVGDPAPSFTLKDLSGTSVSLAGLLQKGPVVLAFFQTTCGPCQNELPLLERLSKDPAVAGVQVVPVSIRQSAATVEAYWQSHGLTLPVLLDSTAATMYAYGLQYIPRLYFVGRDGKVRAELGPASYETIKSHAAALVGGREAIRSRLFDGLHR